MRLHGGIVGASAAEDRRSGEQVVQLNGSDLHLKVGAPPAARVRGLLDYLVGYEVLRPVDTEEPLKGIIPEKLVEESEEDGEADFSQGYGQAQICEPNRRLDRRV